MFCRNCQTIIPDDSLFCENCGAPTGLDPASIDDSNLVPEEAVEFEVEGGDLPLQTSSVPVDPVWWEPPEEEDEPIDVEIEAVFPEENDFREDDAAFAKAGPSPEEADAFASMEESEGIPEEHFPAEDYPANDFPARTDAMKENEPDEDDPDVDAWTEDHLDAGDFEPVIESAAADAEEASDDSDAPDTGDDANEDDADAGDIPDASEDGGASDPAAEESAWNRIWKGAGSGTEEEGTDLTERLEEGMTELKHKAADAADQVRPYAAKAKDWLADLGKHVHTGTGKAMTAARDQLRQKKEEYEKEKEERERRREQERKEKEQEQERREQEQRRKQEEQQAELERLKEEEERASEVVVQHPGFWYGDKMPEPVIAFAPVVKAGSKPAAEETGETGEDGKDIEKTEDAAPVAEDAVRTPSAGTPVPTEEEEAPSPEDGMPLEPEMPPSVAQDIPLPAEEEIEDKLAETTRFDWSRADLEAAAAAAEARASEEAAAIAAAEEAQASEEKTAPVEETAAEEETAAAEVPATEKTSAAEAGESPEEGAGASTDLNPDGTASGPDSMDGSDAGDGRETAGTGADAAASMVWAADQPAAIVEEDVPPDEPALYRIQDFGAANTKRKLPIKKPNPDKDFWKILAIIAAVLVAIGIVTGVMIHQAHVKQLEEEAYQASLTQAHQLVEDEKYKKAEKAYLALIQERPEDTAPYLGLARMYIDQQRYVDAKALIKRAVKTTGDEEAFAEMKKNLKLLTSKKWKKVYRKVLQEYESDIKRYEEDVTASVAVCDVNGDLKPELFFFTKEYYGYGKLHIYTTVSGKAKEVSYECKNRGTQYHDAFYDVSASDSSYAIFNGAGEGEFQIYANVGHGGRSWDTTNEYKMNLKGGCKRQTVIEGSIDTTYGEGDSDDSMYLQDDEDISYDKYIAAFRGMLDGVQQIILYNGSDGDQAVWAKIKPDNVMCMSYDAMMHDLKAQ